MVRATRSEPASARLLVTANGMKISPTMPPTNARGKNTAMVAKEEEATAVATSRTPSLTAVIRSLP